MSSTTPNHPAGSRRLSSVRDSKRESESDREVSVQGSRSNSLHHSRTNSTNRRIVKKMPSFLKESSVSSEGEKKKSAKQTAGIEALNTLISIDEEHYNNVNYDTGSLGGGSPLHRNFSFMSSNGGGDQSPLKSEIDSQRDFSSFSYSLPKTASAAALERNMESEKGRKLLQKVLHDKVSRSQGGGVVGGGRAYSGVAEPEKKRDQLVYRAKSWSAQKNSSHGLRGTHQRVLSPSSEGVLSPHSSKTSSFRDGAHRKAAQDKPEKWSFFRKLEYFAIRYVFVYAVYAFGILFDIVLWILTLGKKGKLPFDINRRSTQVLRTAKKVVGPFLQIETDLDPKNEFGEENYANNEENKEGNEVSLTEEQVLEAQHQRQRINDFIRGKLKDADANSLQKSFKVQCCTWNVDQSPPPPYSTDMLTWLLGESLAEEVDRYHQGKQEAWRSPKQPPFPHRKESVSAFVPEEVRRLRSQNAEELEVLLSKFPDLFVICLQEVEMSGRALMRESSKRSLTWAESITEILSIASDQQIVFKKIKVVQLVGLTLMIFAQLQHVNYISHVRLSLTRTGTLHLLGNKGSVAMRATIYGKRFIFIGAHFSAHKHNEYNRTMNYHAALKDLLFRLPPMADDESEIIRTYAMAVGDSVMSNNSIVDGSFIKGKSTWDRFLNTVENETLRLYYNIHQTQEALYDWETHVLDQHDYVFFIGDLNSRLHGLSSSEIREKLQHHQIDQLLCNDELRQGMVSGEVFDGFQEQWIRFPPTYKFDKGSNRYDTSRKKRDPAWCDRVLFRVLENDSMGFTDAIKASGSHLDEALDSNCFDSAISMSNCSPSQASYLSPLRRTPPPTTPPEEEEWVSLANLSQEQLQLIGEKQATAISSSSDSSSVQEGEVTSKGNEEKDTLGRRETSVLLVEPSHPVWKKKRGFPTFRAATKSLLAKKVKDSNLDDFSVAAAERAVLYEINKPFPKINNRVNSLAYYRVEALQVSDHKPVAATFEVKVIHLPLDTLDQLLVGIGSLFDESEINPLPN